MRGPSRQITTRLVAGAFAFRGDGAREIGDGKSFRPVRHIGEGDGAAGRQCFGG